MKDFLVEHYTQVNEHLRESDRKRDILLGTYFTTSVAGVGFSFGAQVKLEYTISILVFLVCLGLIVAIIVARFRGWHAEYTNVAIAIHKCFVDGHCDLLKAAEGLKPENKCPYFSPRGVEFMMMVLTLLLLSSETVLLVFLICNSLENWLEQLLVIGIPIVIFIFVGGLWQYRAYLTGREKGFPQNSYLVLTREDKGDRVT